MERLPDFGVGVVHLALPGSFPNPSSDDTLSETMRASSRTGTNHRYWLSMGSPMAHSRQPLLDGLDGRVIALVHHPLFLETGLPHARKVELRDYETAALTRADHIIVTSRATKRILTEHMALPSTKITVAEPGTDPSGRATGTGVPLQILAVGAVLPRKGYDVLVDALAKIKDLDWRMTIAGALDRHPASVEQLQAQIDSRNALEGSR